MKNLIICLGVVLCAAACNNKPATETPAAASAVAEGDYPYTLKEPYKKWQTGSEQNTIIVLKMLKAWETKNAEESASYFADTVDMTLDLFQEKMPKDSIVSFLKTGYVNYNNLKVTMQDWESVVSEDKKDEWVTVWYKQSWVNAKGVADSVNCINDVKIANGKIVKFDEYVQHFPAAKK